MKRPENVHCQTCPFWRPTAHDSVGQWGLCRRRADVPDPLRLDSDFCGEHPDWERAMRPDPPTAHSCTEGGHDYVADHADVLRCTKCKSVFP